MKKIFLVLALLSHASGTYAHRDSKLSKGEARQAEAQEYAFGREGNAKQATRTVRVGMADTMRFSPSELTVKRGETVRFIVRNNGKVLHEMVIGTMKELKAHAEMMKKHPGMEHDEPYMAHVAPGKTRPIVWQFTNEGTFHFGCLVPGHLEAGMIGKVEVVK
jgi:uncharacterized cupredoxin-like copper-binding protein